MQRNQLRTVFSVGVLIAGLTLLILLFYTYTEFVFYPYAGFVYHPGSGEVVLIIEQTATPAEDTLRVGDYLLQLGEVSFSDFKNDLRQTFFENAQAGDRIPIRVLRDGGEIKISYRYLGLTLEEYLDRLNSQWFIPYVFWIAGTAALLFLRPRNTLVWLLVLFNYLTAIWIGAGTASASHQMGSALVLRSAIWLSLPVYLHLHYLFPQPLGRPARWVGGLLYGPAVLLGGAQLFQLLPRDAYFLGFSIAVLGSLLLLLIQFVRNAAARRSLIWLLIAAGIALLPPLVIGIMGAAGLTPWYAGVAAFGISALPGVYFYTVYQHQLTRVQRRVRGFFVVYILAILGGTALTAIFSVLAPNVSVLQYGASLSNTASVALTLLMTLIAITSFAPFLILPALANAQVSISADGEVLPRLSANRMAALVLFFMLLAPLAVFLLLAASRWSNYPNAAITTSTLIALLVGAVAVFGIGPFRRFFDRRVLGMPLVPDFLLHEYTDRIATRLTKPDLVSLLTDQVLPTLLVRQSALLSLASDEEFEVVMQMGVEEGQLPGKAALNALHAKSGMGLPATPAGQVPSLPRWVSLVLPLLLNGEVIGFWLFGQRDPESRYTPDEITLLRSLAAETAIALTNIRQAETLLALYSANIQQQEIEQSRIAREIHDDLLSAVAVMGMFLDADTPTMVSSLLDEMSAKLRQLVDDLRTPLTGLGLKNALEELVASLEERVGERPVLVAELTGDDIRFQEEFERHLFRIVQQAVENALQHAQAQMIRVSGEIDRQRIRLSVIDDGIGFDMIKGMDHSDLLYQRHYGLVGMVERAALIQAKIQISSTPGKGTTVLVTWERDEQH